MIIELNQDNFEKETRGGIVVALLYSASSCGDPRGLLEPAANRSYSDEVKFMMIDVEQFPDVAERCGAAKLPAALFMRNGMKKNLIQEVSDAEQIIAAAEENACYRCSLTRKRAEQRGRRR